MLVSGVCLQWPRTLVLNFFKVTPYIKENASWVVTGHQLRLFYFSISFLLFQTKDSTTKSLTRSHCAHTIEPRNGMKSWMRSVFWLGLAESSHFQEIIRIYTRGVRYASWQLRFSVTRAASFSSGPIIPMHLSPVICSCRGQRRWHYRALGEEVRDALWRCGVKGPVVVVRNSTLSCDCNIDV